MIKIAVAAVLVALTASACWGGGHRGPSSWEDVAARATWGVERGMRRLDATDAQTAQAQALKDDVLVAAKPLYDAREPVKNALREEWGSAAPNATRLHGIVDARVADVARVGHAAADAIVKLHAILTPEQRQKISDRLADR